MSDLSLLDRTVYFGLPLAAVWLFFYWLIGRELLRKDGDP